MSGNVLKPVINLIRPRTALHISRQLQLEEALFRSSNEFWCILNWGHQVPTVVLGISGKPELLVHTDIAKKDGIPLLRRYSGGGTVIVSPAVLFISFLMGSEILPQVKPYPRQIMSWSGDYYQRVLDQCCDSTTANSFALRENDYVFGDVKFGGNAQAVSGKRWVHHTSFLWNVDTSLMQYLTNPKKAPEYRQGRDHSEFLCDLESRICDSDDPRAAFEHAFVNSLQAEFDVRERTVDDARLFLNTTYRKSTKWVIPPLNASHPDFLQQSETA